MITMSIGARELADFLDRALGLGRAHAAGRLVEQQQARLGNQRHADLEQRHVAIGQRAGGAARPAPSSRSARACARRAPCRYRDRSAAARNGCRKPRPACAVIQRFSATLSCGNTLLICSVRLMPSRLIWCGFRPVMSRPAKNTRPPSAAAGPDTRLKNVVLPAPFGTDDGMQPAAGKAEAEIVDRGQAAEPLGQIPRCAGQASLMGRFRTSVATGSGGSRSSTVIDASRSKVRPLPSARRSPPGSP